MDRNLKNCFENRLLRKIKPDMEKSIKSIETAGEKLKKAKKTLGAQIFDLSILESYTSMFHAARALMYKDGVQEKSHYCTLVYMKEIYGKHIPPKLINSFNVHRLERHDILYGFDFKASKEDAENALEEAKEFIETIRSILKSRR